MAIALAIEGSSKSNHNNMNNDIVIIRRKQTVADNLLQLEIDGPDKHEDVLCGEYIMKRSFCTTSAALKYIANRILD